VTLRPIFPAIALLLIFGRATAPALAIEPPPDFKKQSIEQLRSSAVAGNSDAMFALGIRYESGEGTLIDLSQAAHWYATAAAKDNVAAMSRLGNLHLDCCGIEQNYFLAVNCFRTAANWPPASDESVGDCLCPGKRRVEGLAASRVLVAQIGRGRRASGHAQLGRRFDDWIRGSTGSG
jgi:hypothetical protein